MFVISMLNRRRLSQDSKEKEFQFNVFRFVVFMPLHHNNFLRALVDRTDVDASH